MKKAIYAMVEGDCDEVTWICLFLPALPHVGCTYVTDLFETEQLFDVNLILVQKVNIFVFGRVLLFCISAVSAISLIVSESLFISLFKWCYICNHHRNLSDCGSSFRF